MRPVLVLALSLSLCTACLDFKDGAAVARDSGVVARDSGETGDGPEGIKALRQGAFAEGATVTVEGVMLGDQLDVGFFLVDPAGGPWSGVWIYAPDDGGSRQQGASLRVTGVYEEYGLGGPEAITELNLEVTGSIEDLGQGSLPAATTLSVAQLSDPSQAEPYESTLVQVEDVVVSEPDRGYGEWVVEGSVVVDDLYYAPAGLSRGQRLSLVRGPLNFHYGEFKIEPRLPRDVAE